MKNILILGAVSPMARATAFKFAGEGWSLTLVDVDDALDGVYAEIVSVATAPVHKSHFNVVDFGSHPTFYNSLPLKPDAVVCAIGYLADQVRVRSDFEESRKTIDVNLLGIISVLNIVAVDFERRGHGSIAAIGSVAGDRGKQGNYIYGSAKGALKAYLSGLRGRMAKQGVHVMTVIPGFCRSSKLEAIKAPAMLISEPEQVADAIHAGLMKRQNTVYVRRMWRWVMLLVQHMPEVLFQRLAYSRFHY